MLRKWNTALLVFCLIRCTLFQDAFPSKAPLAAPIPNDLHPYALSTLYWFVKKGLTDSDLKTDAASPVDFLLSLLEDPNFASLSDVKFLVGDAQKSFNAHRLILAGRSPIFKNVFGESPAPGSVIVVNDMQPDVFSAVLRYIYGKVLPTNPDMKLLFGMIHGGQRYVIPSLVDASITLVNQLLGPGNVVWTLEHAIALDQPDLIERCWLVVRTQAKTVVESSEFEKVTLAFLRSLLQQDRLDGLSEARLFDRIVDWAEHRMDSGSVLTERKLQTGASALRNFLEPVLYDFRFLSMTGEEFAKGPCSSGILTKDEQFEILLSIGNGDDGRNWRSKFSKLRRIH